MAEPLSIVPHRGVGPITFGMARTEVARAVGEPARPERRGASEYDRFERSGLMVYYDATGLCEAVELRRPARVSFDGYELFAHPAHEAREWARARDPALAPGDGFISRALGLSMYAPAIDEPDLEDDERAEPAETFLAFKPGYYDQD